MARRKLGELLVEAGVIDEMQLQSALGEQKKWGGPLGQTLIELGFVSENALVRALSEQLNIPAVDLQAVSVSAEALQRLDHDFCLTYSCLPFGYDEKGPFLDVAMADPTNAELYDVIRVRTRCNVRPHLAGHRAIEVAVRREYLGERPPTDLSVDNRHWVRRPAEIELESPAAPSPPAAPEEKLARPVLAAAARDQLLMQLHETVRQLVANVERDEKVIRKLMSLLVEKGVCTRSELVAKIYED